MSFKSPASVVLSRLFCAGSFVRLFVRSLVLFVVVLVVVDDLEALVCS